MHSTEFCLGLKNSKLRLLNILREGDPEIGLFKLLQALTQWGKKLNLHLFVSAAM